MTDQPNSADFTADEKPGEYEAVLKIEGTMRVTIKAESPDHAKQLAEDMTDTLTNDIDDIEMDDVEDVSVYLVRKTPKMYRVTRDGQTMQVSRLEPGDMPREADERGF